MSGLRRLSKRETKRAASNGRVSPAAIVACLVCSLVASVYVAGRAASTRAASSSDAGPPRSSSPAPQGGHDFSKFLHTSRRHASLACASCHARDAGNAAAPRLPGHKACTDCHLPQFVSPNIPMCAICHTDVESQNPPVRNFPALRSFNARFDHAQHSAGAARPPEGCAACHRQAARRAAAMTIPVGLGAHGQCYACHTPGSQAAGRDIASCGVCHQIGRYARTPAASRAFAVAFSHATHGPRQRLACGDCHALRAGLPQSRQVTSTRFAQHFAAGGAQTCASCHNDRRRTGARAVFGDADFANCAKCHKRQTFRLGP